MRAAAGLLRQAAEPVHPRPQLRAELVDELPEGETCYLARP